MIQCLIYLTNSRIDNLTHDPQPSFSFAPGTKIVQKTHSIPELENFVGIDLNIINTMNDHR